MEQPPPELSASFLPQRDEEANNSLSFLNSIRYDH
jgi:hypothetical protein